MANYPSGVSTFPARSDGQTIFAQHVQLLQDEVAAIEAGLLGGLAHTLWGAQGFTLSGVLSPPQITADQNDYAPAGLSTAFALRLSADAARSITGILSQGTGRLLCLINYSSFPITLPFNSPSSAAANRIVGPSSTNFVLVSNGCCWLWYDVGTGFWRIVSGPLTASAGSAPTYTGCKIYNTAAQSIGAAAYTAVTFAGADYNVGPMWAAGAPTRMTVPAGQTGLYLAYAKIQSNVNSNNRLRFLRNGTPASTEMRFGSAAVASISAMDVALLMLGQNDYVEVQVYLSAAGTIGGTADSITEAGLMRQNPA